MDHFTIEITQDHIDRGTARSATSCPIALAVREYGQGNKIWCLSTPRITGNLIDGTHGFRKWRKNAYITDLITRFDTEQAVNPFTLHLDAKTKNRDREGEDAITTRTLTTEERQQIMDHLQPMTDHLCQAIIKEIPNPLISDIAGFLPGMLNHFGTIIDEPPETIAYPPLYRICITRSLADILNHWANEQIDQFRRKEELADQLNPD